MWGDMMLETTRALRLMPLLIASIVALAMLMHPHAAAASTTTESARAAKIPWSGHWWPTLNRQGSVNLYDRGGPLEKYDRFVQARSGTASQARQWELRNRYTENPSATWWGHCHAWAAASIMLPEPPNGVTRRGVSFTQDDLKGLVTAMYHSPVIRWINGSRAYPEGHQHYSAAAWADMHPAWLDYVTRLYIGYYRHPVIYDIDRGPEVWNFPAYAYTRSATRRSDGSLAVTLRVRFASATLNTRGTRFFERTYTYVLRSGTLGQYTGASRTNHPDFSWIPGGRQATGVNPHLSAAVINEIIGGGYRV